MKVVTVLGTRPEIIRLSLVIELLDKHAEKHVLVHTGQNYDARLNDVFFEEMGVRRPDVYLGAQAGSAAGQIAQIIERIEKVFVDERPDRLLILGDTNSGLTALVARRMGIPVYHMEAGNRCYDDRVPEEVNRRVIDHCSTVLMPYTHNSKENLMREGIESNRIYVTGNPIRQVIEHYRDRVNGSSILADLGLEKGKYFIVTMHRAENVDHEDRLRAYVESFQALYKQYGFPVVCSFHPRTRSKVEKFGVDLSDPGLRFLEPFGFFDFVNLELNAFCILSDSGTVQEEACIYKIPNVTIRDVTERPETVECGSNILTGANPDRIQRAVEMVTSKPATWEPPAEYMAPSVAETTVRIVTGYRVPKLGDVS